MKIELEEYTLPQGKIISDVDAYPSGSGIYLVYDGITYHVVIKENDNILNFMYIPISIIKQYIASEAYESGKIDVLDEVKKSIELVVNSINELKNVRIENKSNCVINDNTLLKAIAISRDAELAKDLI